MRSFSSSARPSASSPEPGPTPKPKPPSESERIKALPEEERQWLTEFVAAIILEEEKKAFLELQATYRREVFKREFWERREQPGLPMPLGSGYRFRYEELRRLAEPKYKEWLDIARPLLTEEDLSRFLQSSVAERDRFIREFWKRQS